MYNKAVTIQRKNGLTTVIMVRQMPHDKTVTVGQKANYLGYPGGVVVGVRDPNANMEAHA